MSAPEFCLSCCEVVIEGLARVRLCPLHRAVPDLVAAVERGSNSLEVAVRANLDFPQPEVDAIVAEHAVLTAMRSAIAKTKLQA